MPTGFGGLGTVANLGAMMIELAGDSSQLDKELKRTQSNLANFGNAIDAGARRIDRSLTRAFAVGAAVVASLGAAAIKVGADFDSGMARVAAVTGATGEELQSLTDKARDIGKTTQFSASEAADAMYVLAQAGMDTAEIMDSVQAVMVLAGASGMDMEAAANLVAASLKQFNLPASQAAHVVDVLNTSAQKSLLSMSDLRDAMKYAGTAGAGFGLSLEQTVAAVAQFRDLGLSASQSGTALRTALTRLVDPPKAARKVLEDLGLTLNDVSPEVVGFDGAMRALAKSPITAAQSMALFGKYSGASINGVINSFRTGKSTFDELVTALTNGTGSAQATFERMQQSVTGQFLLLRNKANELLLTMFDSLKGPLTRLITGLQARVEALTGEFQRSGDSIEAMANSVVDAILAVTDAMIELIPNLRAIAVLMAAAFVGSKGVQLVVAVQSLAMAVGVNLVAALTDATVAFVALGVAGAGFSVTAVGGIVAGLALLAVGVKGLWDELTGAADEAARLHSEIVKAQAVKGGLNNNAAQLREQAAALTEIIDSYEKVGVFDAVNDVANTIMDPGMWDRASEAAGRQITTFQELVDTRDTYAAQADEIDRRNKANQRTTEGVTGAAKGLKDAVDEGADVDDKAAKAKAKLVEQLEAIRSAADAGYAAQLKLAKAMDEIDAAEQAGVDPAMIAKAREAAWAEFGSTVGASVDKATFAVDDWSATNATAEEQVRAWTAAQVAWNAAMDAGRTAAEAAAEAGQAYSASIQDGRAAVDEASGSMVQAAGSTDLLASGMGGLQGAAMSLVGSIGSQMIGFFQQFTDAVLGTTAAVMDLSRVLNFVQTFTSAHDALAEWRDAVAEAQHALDIASARNGDPEYAAHVKDAQSELNDLLNNKPLGPAGAQAQAVADQVDWLSGFIKALPKMADALKETLPELLILMAKAIPSVLLTLGKAAPAIFGTILDALLVLLTKSDKIVRATFKVATGFTIALILMVPKLMTAVLVAAPRIIEALIEELPPLLYAFGGAGTYFIAAVVAELPHMAVRFWNVMVHVVDNLANRFVEIVSGGIFTGNGKGGIALSDSGLGGLFQDLGDAVSGAWSSVFGRNRHARGIRYVPHTMAAVLEPGESVLDRAATRRAARGTEYPPAGPVPVHGGAMAQVLVALDGQVVDAQIARSSAAGRMPKYQRALRSGRGTKVGYSPGRLNVWG